MSLVGSNLFPVIRCAIFRSGPLSSVLSYSILVKRRKLVVSGDLDGGVVSQQRLVENHDESSDVIIYKDRKHTGRQRRLDIKCPSNTAIAT